MDKTAVRRIEPWPVIIIVFFLVVFVVNAILVYLSQSSWNGLITQDAYNKGIAFNQALEAQRKQDALGWQVRLQAEGLVSGRSGAFRLVLTDRNQAPLTGVRVEGVLFRPVQEGMDQTLTWSEEAPGVWQALLTPSLPGAWDVKLHITHGEQQEFRFAQRILVAAPTP